MKKKLITLYQSEGRWYWELYTGFRPFSVTALLTEHEAILTTECKNNGKTKIG